MYWGFGMCSLRSMQVELLNKYLVDSFKDRLNNEASFNEMYLNEYNEW